MKNPTASLLVALLLVSVPAVAGGPERPGDEGSNILVRLALADDGHDQSMQALVLDGQRLRTTTGWRVPTATTVGGGSGASGATTFQYQDVGTEISLQARIVGPERVRISGEVELGRIAPDQPAPAATPPATPTVATFRHVFDVIVRNGVETSLAQVPKPGGGSARLEITAEFQD